MVRSIERDKCEILREVYPEPFEILHFVLDDKKRRTQNDNFMKLSPPPPWTGRGNEILDSCFRRNDRKEESGNDRQKLEVQE